MPSNQTSKFKVKDRVKSKLTGNLGTVVELEEDGFPVIQLDGSDWAGYFDPLNWEIISNG